MLDKTALGLLPEASSPDEMMGSQLFDARWISGRTVGYANYLGHPSANLLGLFARLFLRKRALARFACASSFEACCCVAALSMQPYKHQP